MMLIIDGSFAAFWSALREIIFPGKELSLTE